MPAFNIEKITKKLYNKSENVLFLFQFPFVLDDNDKLTPAIYDLFTDLVEEFGKK